ncbi:hypothetical protein [Embleya sp. NBC_00896]|uniref:hypothetical protein n=1 Tax=Embleya sp. NBC_00896 TaxID=2975961 RepID=UPI00386FEBC2|nr:hypothetical protein OG928_05250 [Embleya sp. NBC_00896]
MHEAQTRETSRHDWRTLHTGTRESAARALREDLVHAGVSETDLARRVTEAWAGSVVTVASTGRQFRVTRITESVPVGPIAEPQRADSGYAERRHTEFPHIDADRTLLNH